MPIPVTFERHPTIPDAILVDQKAKGAAPADWQQLQRVLEMAPERLVKTVKAVPESADKTQRVVYLKDGADPHLAMRNLYRLCTAYPLGRTFQFIDPDGEGEKAEEAEAALAEEVRMDAEKAEAALAEEARAAAAPVVKPPPPERKRLATRQRIQLDFMRAAVAHGGLPTHGTQRARLIEDSRALADDFMETIVIEER